MLYLHPCYLLSCLSCAHSNIEHRLHPLQPHMFSMFFRVIDIGTYIEIMRRTAKIVDSVVDKPEVAVIRLSGKVSALAVCQLPVGSMVEVLRYCSAMLACNIDGFASTRCHQSEIGLSQSPKDWLLRCLVFACMAAGLSCFCCVPTVEVRQMWASVRCGHLSEASRWHMYAARQCSFGFVMQDTMYIAC